MSKQNINEEGPMWWVGMGTTAIGILMLAFWVLVQVLQVVVVLIQKLVILTFLMCP